MNDIPEHGLPEGLKVLAEAAPVPPIPSEAADRLEETEEFFFATDRREPPVPPMLPEDLPEEADAAGVRWLAFGVRGRGLQGKRFDYYLLSDGLRIAVTLPWARIYGDKDEERDALETAFHLVRLCLAREFDGRRLEVSLNRVRCSWRLTSNGETIVEGEGVDSLLDELGLEDADVPMQYWISV